MLTTLILVPKEKLILKAYIQESMLCLVSHSAPVISAFKCEATILSDQLKSYWHWEKNKSLLYFGITQKDSLGSHINSVVYTAT